MRRGFSRLLQRRVRTCEMPSTLQRMSWRFTGDAAIRAFTSSTRLSCAAITSEGTAEGGSSSPQVTTSMPLPKVVEEGTAEVVRRAYSDAVRQRRVGNHLLRQQMNKMSDPAKAAAAVAGAQDGGLHVAAGTHEVLMKRLLESGNLQSSLSHYQTMLRSRMTPTTGTYAALAEMCIDREVPQAAIKLYEDMSKRGVAPNTAVVASTINAISMIQPCKWADAVALFEKASTSSTAQLRLDHNVYRNLMKVYSNMDDFEWHVVYNCYHEMRNTRPPIRFTWETYYVVSKAMKRGGASRFRRLMTFVDAWFFLTPMWSVAFWRGAFITMLTLKFFQTLFFHFCKSVFKPPDPGMDFQFK